MRFLGGGRWDGWALTQIRSTHRELYNAIVRLQQNDPTLIKLDLGFQKIGDREASVLAEALAQNTTLSTLVLEGNQIGEVGASGGGAQSQFFSLAALPPRHTEHVNHVQTPTGRVGVSATRMPNLRPARNNLIASVRKSIACSVRSSIQYLSDELHGSIP